MKKFEIHPYTVEAIPEGIRKKQSQLLDALQKTIYENNELECMRVVLLEEFKLVKELEQQLKECREALAVRDTIIKSQDKMINKYINVIKGGKG